jgi:hypothetical protein
LNKSIEADGESFALKVDYLSLLSLNYPNLEANFERQISIASQRYSTVQEDWSR